MADQTGYLAFTNWNTSCMCPGIFWPELIVTVYL